MSRYGPPGEQYGLGPGPEEYGPPSDPWGQPVEQRGGQGTSPVGYPDSGYPPSHPDPSYPHQSYPGQPYPDQRYAGQSPYPDQPYPPDYDTSPAPPPRRPIGLYALVVVLVVLAASGVGYALFLLSGDDSTPVANPTGVATPTAAAVDTPGPAATINNIGMNAAMALVDDCLVNDGGANNPQMRIVPCDTGGEGSQVFQILAIFNEQVTGDGDAANEEAQAVCADTEGYTHHYYEVGETASFVLCMAELD